MHLVHPKREVYLNKVLVLNLTGIGDSVCLIPFLERLKTSNPEMKLWGCFSPSQVDLMKSLFPFDGVVTGRSLREIASNAKKQIFSLVIVPGWALKHTIAALKIGSPLLGYLNDRSFTINYLPRYTLEGVGVPASLKQQDMKTAHLIERPNLILEELNLEPINYQSYQIKNESRSGTHIVIHPTARFKGRRWETQNYVLLINRLYEVLDCLDAVYLIGGQEDYATNETIAQTCSGLVVNKAGTLAMHDLPQLFAKSGLFIGSDSGPMHIAAFSGVAVIGLMGPNLPELSGPVGQYSHAVFHRQECAPCEQKGCVNDYACMKAITVEEVVEVATKAWKPV